MAIVRFGAPRHILYIVVVLAALAAPAACTQPQEAEREETGAPESAPPTASPAPSPAAPTPTQPTAADSTAGETSAADQASRTTAGQPRPAPSSGTATAPTAPPGETASTTQPPSSAGLDADESFHLDDAEVEYELPRRPARPRKGRPVQIMLRSSPPGAVAAVDGVTVGPTPALWEGVVDATPREFTFVLAGYAIARYRFVPTRSGIVHGTLEPIKPEGDDERNRKRRRDGTSRPPGQPAPAAH